MNGTHIKKAVHSHSCAEKAPTRASILTHTLTHTKSMRARFHTEQAEELLCLPFRTAPWQVKAPKSS